jgi:hypothetical protein
LVVVVVVVLCLVGGPVGILVVLGFVVDLVVVVVSVVVFARVLGSLGVVALRGHRWCCCCYSTGSLGALASGGVRGRRRSRRSGLSLASRSSHVDTRTGSVVDQQARDAGPEGRSADGFAVRLEVFGCFGPVDLKGVESVLRYAGWSSSRIRKDRSNSRDDTYTLAHDGLAVVGVQMEKACPEAVSVGG